MTQGTVERAFQLAREGSCAGLQEIRIRLTREGFSNVQGHLEGSSIKRQLTDIIKRAAGATAPVDGSETA